MSENKKSRSGRLTQKSPAEDTGRNEKTARRQATVYDAVAGRVGRDGLLESSTRQIKSRNGFPCTHSAFNPLEALLRRVGAPTTGRADVYFADEHLETDQKLPDSELLKAVHAYASDYYNMQTEERGQSDYRSLDETALIALGVLLEEAAIQVLGETGDMVLVEPEGFDSFAPETRATQMQLSGRVPQSETPPYMSEESSDDSDDDRMRTRKRRRPRNDDMS